MISYPRFLNLNEACDVLNIDKSTFRNWRMNNDDFPPSYQPKGSRSVRYDVDELVKWLKSHPVKSAHRTMSISTF